jgi:hypothetical protein
VRYLNEKKYRYGIILNNELDAVFNIAEAIGRFASYGFYDKEGQYRMAIPKNFLGSTEDFLEFKNWFGEFNEYTPKEELYKIRKKWYDYAESDEMADLMFENLTGLDLTL